MLALKLFGSPSLETDDGPLTGPATQRHRIALLAMLAAAHPNGLSRDTLLAHLWPERDTEHGRNLVKQAIHALRRALGAEAIVSVHDVVRLDASGLLCDVIAFEDALAAGENAVAVRHYRGPFLDGFFLSDAAEFEHWVDRQRARFSDAHAKALETLAVTAEAEGHVTAAAEWWKLRAAHDPYDSRVTLRLMQALVASGNRAAALQLVELHRRLLRAEFEVEPARELIELAERLRADPPSPVVLTAATSESSGSVAMTDSTVPVAIDGAAAVTPRALENASLQSRMRSRGSRPAWQTIALAVSGLLMVFVSLAWLLPVLRADARASDEITDVGTRAIAVLPFEDPEATEEDAAFARGIHSDLITALSTVRAFAVISRESVLRYAGGTTSLRQIGEGLAVDALLEGSVQRQSERVRINVQLSDARSGRVLWAQTYERGLTVRNLFAMQSDITERIATALAASLSPSERERIAAAPTEDLTAYQLYHRAREVFDGTRAGNLESARLLYLALAADSGYTPAWAELAITYGWRAPNLGFSTAAWDTALSFARRALDLDPELARAHTALASIYGHQGHLAREERAALRALELNPSDALALRRLAESHRERGRFIEALRHHEATVRLSPASLPFRVWVGITYANLEDFTAAERWYRGVLDGDPNYLSALEGMATLYLQLAQPDSARHYAGRIVARHSTEPRGLATAAAVSHYLRDFAGVERLAGQAIATAPDAPVRAGAAAGYGSLATTMLGFARLQSGDRAHADALFRQSLAFLEPLIAQGVDSPRWPYEIGLIHAARGEPEVALTWLEAAVAQGFRWAWMLELDPILDPLRTDRRFSRLIARVRADLARNSSRRLDSRGPD